MCSIFTAPSNHKYDTVDYFSVDKHFGDETVLRKLIEMKHIVSGMRIMLDAVFNHIGYESIQWQDVLQNGENSIYKGLIYYSKIPGN